MKKSFPFLSLVTGHLSLAKRPRGFSMGELLVVIVIVALLAITILMAYQNQVAKANDSKRKDHFNQFKIALEDYYNDKSCYPTVTDWNGYTCDGTEFAPYMDKFLCDPTTRQRYLYQSFTDEDGNPDSCLGYKLYTKLEYKGDPDIIRVGCDWVQGCGTTDALKLVNFGIGMGGPLTAADFIPNPTSTATPTPTQTPSYGPFGCNPSATCNNSYGKADLDSGRCSVLFSSMGACRASGCPVSIRCRS
jgi:prepilin-type N-terminal cleavage/methylation domain-containing protein